MEKRITIRDRSSENQRKPHVCDLVFREDRIELEVQTAGSRSAVDVVDLLEQVAGALRRPKTRTE